MHAMRTLNASRSPGIRAATAIMHTPPTLTPHWVVHLAGLVDTPGRARWLSCRASIRMLVITGWFWYDRKGLL
jgi:hypothetical protein